MSQRWAMLIAAVVVCSGFLIGASAIAGPGAPAARAAALTGTWGTAEQVPGSSTLNIGGDALGIASLFVRIRGQLQCWRHLQVRYRCQWQADHPGHGRDRERRPVGHGAAGPRRQCPEQRRVRHDRLGVVHRAG